MSSYNVGVAPSYTYGEAATLAELEGGFFRTAVTAEDGCYLFEGLPVHEAMEDMGDAPKLYGYKVYLLEMPVNEDGEPYAAAYYQANGSAGDSALAADTMQVVKKEWRGKRQRLERNDRISGAGGKDDCACGYRRCDDI